MTKHRLTLLIGPTEKAAVRFRSMFKQKAAPLEKAGIAVPNWNPVRLYTACAQADDISALRHRRNLGNPLLQQTITAEFNALFANELPQIEVPHVIMAAAQLGTLLHRPDELIRLKDLLSPYFDDIQIVAHVDEQARLLVQHYASAVLDGRVHPLDQEIALAQDKDWRAGALAMHGQNAPFFGIFNDAQRPPFWLDYVALLTNWEAAFGKDNVTLHPLNYDALNAVTGIDALCTLLGIENTFGKTNPDRVFSPEAAASLTRMRQMNDVLSRYGKARRIIIPREFWGQVHKYVRVLGNPIQAGSLAAVSKHFETANAALIKRFPDLKTALQPDPPASPWEEVDPTMGFRATQYLAAFAAGIRNAAIPVADKEEEVEATAEATDKFQAFLATNSTDDTGKELLNRIKVNHQNVLTGPFKPHNDFGTVNEESPAPPYTPVAPRDPPAGSTGNVIVACMKNEAPYILEWIAYHRAIGVDHFLIYTNDCNDGTDKLLHRLMEMGVVTHRNNNNWKGNSPQQHALNRSLKEPVIHDAEWIIHIDVDEFMNVRTGNGTLADFLAAVPDATNVAMTWRLFGHNDVTELNDGFVIDQFDTCAPSFCPKPHTVWGFKSMFRNIGAYAKISCHRPNKLEQGYEKKVKWVNGSGQDVSGDLAQKGWRSSKTNVGYDLLQLNHYALRSAESFLIKRERGRALHVDRAIGLNYWIRMDWSDFRDITIKRNIPRMAAEVMRLLEDKKLAKLHERGCKWHKNRAAKLRATPEFGDLYDQALRVKLNETQRVAYALSLDMES